MEELEDVRVEEVREYEDESHVSVEARSLLGLARFRSKYPDLHASTLICVGGQVGASVADAKSLALVLIAGMWLLSVVVILYAQARKVR